MTHFKTAAAGLLVQRVEDWQYTELLPYIKSLICERNYTLVKYGLGVNDTIIGGFKTSIYIVHPQLAKRFFPVFPNYSHNVIGVFKLQRNTETMNVVSFS